MHNISLKEKFSDRKGVFLFYIQYVIRYYYFLFRLFGYKK